MEVEVEVCGPKGIHVDEANFFFFLSLLLFHLHPCASSGSVCTSETGVNWRGERGGGAVKGSVGVV